MKELNKEIIGRREIISLPKLGIFNIESKVDTGAYTTALHTNKVHLHRKNNRLFATFNIDDSKYPIQSAIEITALVKKIKKVKNTSGIVEERIIIRTLISISGRKYKIDLSLADRTNMEYPILIGRKAIKGKFLVDVSSIYCGTANTL
ncbi:MAG: RimK/LysX family protein [Bacteroidota bacterium]|nr:RimK/LysX family protein [Bacteroidota bacterium]